MGVAPAGWENGWFISMGKSPPINRWCMVYFHGIFSPSINRNGVWKAPKKDGHSMSMSWEYHGNMVNSHSMSIEYIKWHSHIWLVSHSHSMS